MDYGTKNERSKSFATGVARSDTRGKGRYDLVSPLAMRKLALVYERGGHHRGDRNWEKGFPLSRCLDSALRHIYQYLEGMRDEEHIAQAIWNLVALIHIEECIERGILPKKLNDLPNYQKGGGR